MEKHFSSVITSMEKSKIGDKKVKDIKASGYNFIAHLEDNSIVSAGYYEGMNTVVPIENVVESGLLNHYLPIQHLTEGLASI